MTFCFRHCHHSAFLPNNQILFPTVQPESEQETLPLPDSAEPKWPRVSFGNTDDALLPISITRLSWQPVFTCFSSAPGKGPGLGSAAVLIGCLLACLEPS